MYDTKENIYFQNVRKELLNLIPQKSQIENMLEIGAGEGNTLLYAKKNNLVKNIFGIELFKMEHSNQNSKEFAGFVIGNIEKIDFPFENKEFDVIILGDVLEHLIDPYTVLNNLKKYLKSDGVIIASIPNVREWNTMKKIFFKGDFRYEDSGILDKTHLRFFTKKNIVELFENQGYHLIDLISNAKKPVKYLKGLKFIKFFFRIFSDEFFATQYYVVAKKNI